MDKKLLSRYGIHATVIGKCVHQCGGAIEDGEADLRFSSLIATKTIKRAAANTLVLAHARRIEV